MWTRDILKYIVLLCILALSKNTLTTLPYLQHVLDNACCGRGDFPITHTHRQTHRKPSPPIQESRRRNSCLVHKAVAVTALSRTRDNPQPKKGQSKSTTNQNANTTNTTLLLEHFTPTICAPLRRDVWTTSYAVTSPTARDIASHQANCTLPLATYHVDNDFGLGSHLYVWSQAVCNAMELGYRVQSYNPDWLWLDQAYCSNKAQSLSNSDDVSPFSCYFPSMEHQCPTTDDHIESTAGVAHPQQPRTNLTHLRDVQHRCRRIRDGHPSVLTDFRAASIEYIFRDVAPLLVHEAERQSAVLFGPGGAPDHMVTVHLRWGDKFWEMDLAPVEEYVTAVAELLSEQRDRTNNNVTATGSNAAAAHIYLASEDPRAVRAFLDAAPDAWTVYTDLTVTELDPFRPAKGNRASWTTRNTRGRAGLVALGSLLVALEADSFVLTTASNWSRMMNDLRRYVLDPRCGNCTRMIDLRPGEW